VKTDTFNTFLTIVTHNFPEFDGWLPTKLVVSWLIDSFHC